MARVVKWLLVLPAAIGASVLAFAGLTLLWFLQKWINIVPQEDIVSYALATFFINAAAAGAGVAAGANTAPSHHGKVAVAIAVLMVLAAPAVLFGVTGFRERSITPFWWHVFGGAAWIIGAVIAAVALWKR